MEEEIVLQLSRYEVSELQRAVKRASTAYRKQGWENNYSEMVALWNKLQKFKNYA